MYIRVRILIIHLDQCPSWPHMVVHMDASMRTVEEFSPHLDLSSAAHQLVAQFVMHLSSIETTGLILVALMVRDFGKCV